MKRAMMLCAGAAVAVLAGVATAHERTEQTEAEMAAGADRGVHLGHAWVRPPLGGRDVTAGYGRLHNPTGEDDRLIAVSTPIATAVELHANERDGDVVRMVKQDGINSPADSHVELEPGGMHLMLFGVTEPLAEGDLVPLSLTFEHAGEVEAQAVVAQSQPEEHDPHDAH